VNPCQNKNSVPGLIGNSAKIKDNLGWQLNSDFKSWVCEMVDHDVRLINSTLS
jgi:GDP-D-mannose dehydratase